MRDVNVLEVGSADAILAAVLLLLVIVCCHDVFATFLMASSMEVIQFKKKKVLGKMLNISLQGSQINCFGLLGFHMFYLW